MWKLDWRPAIAGGLALLFMTAAGAAPGPRPAVPGAGLPPAALGAPCLAGGKAYLRARIRGSLRLDVDLHGAALTCEGGPRLDGSGIRMGFAGRAGSLGEVRLIFGMNGAREGRSGRELPTNLTVIFEDRKLLFATQGSGNCTVDRLMQEPIGTARAPTRPQGAAAPAARAYRIVAHGFCIAPVNDVSGRRRIVVTTFDFAGRAEFATPTQEEDPRS